jgi:hypothetical protein
VLRGGYGRFYDKTHFELIGNIYTNTVFATSFVRNFPLQQADQGPRTGNLPTDPFLVNGPVITDAMRAELARMFPAGQTNRNTGANWDNPDRRMPYTDQYTIGYERQLGTDFSASVDYVRANSRDLLISRELNPQVRNSTTVAGSTLTRAGSDVLTATTEALRQTYGSSFAAFSTGVAIPENAARTNYDAVLLALERRFRNNYSARVSYTYSNARGNTNGVGIPTSGFQVLDDLNLGLNEGRTNTDVPHNFVVSGSAMVPRTGGLTVSWIARALSGTPFSLLDQRLDPDRNGLQVEPLAAGTYSGNGDDAYTVEDFASERNGARGPGFFKLDMRLGYTLRFAARRVEVFGEIFNVTNRTNFANPSGNLAATDFLTLTGLSTSTNSRLLQLGARFVF